MNHKPPPNRIEVEARALKTALQGLSKIVSTRPSLPVLGTLRVEAPNSGSGQVSLTATDLDVWFTIRIPAEIPSPQTTGDPFLVSLSRIKDIVKAARPKHVIDLAKWRADDREGKSGNLQLKDFPSPPAISSRIKSVELDEPAQEDLLQAMLCSSKDETRYVLRGVYLDPDNEQLAATDGRHLACFGAPYLKHGALKKPVILPAHKLWSWRGLRTKDQTVETWKLRIGYSKSSTSSSSERAPVFRLDGPHWTFSGKCIEGKYPNFAQVIPSPDQFQTRLEFNPADLGAIAQAISQLPGKQIQNHPIGLRISDETVGVLYRESENDSYQEIGIPFLRKSGPDLSISFNRDYFLKALRFGFHRMDLGDPISPVKFSNGKQGLMIVMPLRNEVPDRVPQQVAKIRGVYPESKPQPKPKSNSPQIVNKRSAKRNGNEGQQPPHPIKPRNRSAPCPDTSQTDPIDQASHQITETKEALKHALSCLSGLSTTLKMLRQQQRSTDRDMRTVRSTLRSLTKIDL